MITLKDSIEIKTTPEQVYNWLTNIRTDKDYQAWHPDHVDWIWIKGEPFREDSVAYSKEYLHGELHKFKFSCNKIVPNRLIEYEPLFPWSIVMLKSGFYIESKGQNTCMFTATISFKSVPLLARFIGNKLEAIKQHMKEEGENLKTILER